MWNASFPIWGIGDPHCLLARWVLSSCSLGVHRCQMPKTNYGMPKRNYATRAGNFQDLGCLILLESVSFPPFSSGTLKEAAQLSKVTTVPDSPKAVSKNKKSQLFTVHTVTTHKPLPIFLALTWGQNLFHWPLFTKVHRLINSHLLPRGQSIDGANRSGRLSSQAQLPEPHTRAKAEPVCADTHELQSPYGGFSNDEQCFSSDSIY